MFINRNNHRGTKTQRSHGAKRIISLYSLCLRASVTPSKAALFSLVFILAVSNVAANQPKKNRTAIKAVPFTAQAHYVMGTMLEIQLPATASDKLFAQLFSIARRHDEVFSTFKPESPISQFNRSNRKQTPFAAPDEIIELTSISQRLAEQTAGAFDVTVGPLVEMWKQAVKQQQWPDAQTIEAARRRVGVHQIAVDLKARSIKALADGVELDFNGIAKGYSVDRMADALKAAGVAQAFINFGESSIYALGAGPDGRAWSVAVRDPQNPNRSALTLRISNVAISSSASYEHSSQIGNRTINHIVDPRTGLPANAQAAVTVIAPSATIADALSTALVVLAPGEGLKVLEKFPGAEAVIFYRSDDGRWKRAMSKGMQRYIQPLNTERN